MLNGGRKHVGKCNDMSQQLAGEPFLILQSGWKSSSGIEVLHGNVMAVRVLAEFLKSTLGPKGLEKMLVDHHGDVKVTGDGR